MNTIQEILRHYGYDAVSDVPVGEHIKLEIDGFEDLVIEKTGHMTISVAQYYEQRGDLMADPDIVFRVIGDDWIPIEYTNHGLSQYRYSESGLPHLAGLVKTWDKNLKAQGFVEAARQAASASGQEVTA